MRRVAVTAVGTVLVLLAGAAVYLTTGADTSLSWKPKSSVDIGEAVNVPEASPSPTLDSCGPLAFDKPSVSALRSSRRKAFAFYFPPFPVSVENKPPASDYYSQWLNTGDATGRYDLRDRPIPRPVRSGSTWKQKDFETEVRQAIAIGLDGFIWE